MKRICMDYQAGMPTDPRVVKAMMPYFSEIFGNPSSTHSLGQEVKIVVEGSREKIADLIGVKKKDSIIFTSGGTESNNLAIAGVAFRNKDKGNQIITTAIEHMSVLNTCKSLEKKGFKVTYIPVDKQGVVDVDSLRKEITNETILISVMYANGEIGTIQPIKEIGEIAHEKNICFHSDAVAAAGVLPIDVEEENIDLLSISSNDMYGPKGVGALYIREGIKIVPIVYGGGQERGLRSGSENIPSIVGLGKAAEIIKSEREMESSRLTKLRDKLTEGILSNIPQSFLNGHPVQRLPNNANVRFSYIEGESLILSLDMEGVSVSSGSACTSKTLEPSRVLRAIDLPHEEAHGSLLFSLGRENSDEDIKYVLGILSGIVNRLRAMSPLTPKESNMGQ
ncbi:MAG: IscS subfamily cysteine desulfurase [Candidatus Bathyarchaeota archaeon]